jgi:hypothetical protein
MATPPKPRVFVDSDVLFAGAASPSEHGASLVVLRMAEITLIDAVVSEQVIIEVERNLVDYLRWYNSTRQKPIKAGSLTGSSYGTNDYTIAIPQAADSP